MRAWQRAAAALTCCATMSASIAMDDDKAVDSHQQLGLNNDQQRAVGIVAAHPVAVKAPERIDALGLVLDATVLISERGDASSAAAAQRSSAAELERLHALHAGGAGASLKMLEAAQAEQAKTQAQSEIAAARFALHWGPLASLPAGERQKIIDASASGRSLLLHEHTAPVCCSGALVIAQHVQQLTGPART